MELETLEVKIQAQARQANGQIDALITRLGRLSSALSGLSTGNLNSLATGVNRLAGAMTAMRGIDTRTFSAVARNVSKLGSINSKQINAAAGSMRQISNAVKGLSGMSASVKGLTELASAIKQLGYQSSTKAIENIPKLAVAMRQLMAELSKAPMVSQNLINMTNALAKLSRTGASSGRAASSLGAALDKYTASTHRASKGSFSLSAAIGKVYATYWLLFRAMGKIRDAIDISSQLTEVQNIVDVTFGNMAYKVEDFAKTSIQQFGMSELSLKQYASRFQAMGSAMGISGSSIGSANDFLSKQTKGYVGASNSMADMSLNLTKLTADMASFYNVEQDVVAEDLEAIFTGQTRPLRQYGLDLTQATLQEWALKNGIDANVQSMSQAEKTMLRYQYVMANTGAAHDDFAKTVNTWANQVRILKQNFQQLGAVVGGTLINAFKPLVQALNSVMGKLIAFAETVSNALGKIFGWKFEKGSGGAGTTGLATDMEDAADSAGGLADKTGKAAKNIDKMKAGLRAFDELKTISMPDSNSGSGGGSGSGGSGGGASGASGSGGQWVKQDSIFEDYKSSIDSLYKLGDYIGDALKGAMDSIDWNSIYQKAEGFGKGLADFLNGLFSGEKGETLLGKVGKTIAGTLNTVISASLGFTKNFDFKQFGLNLSDAVNQFFETFKFDKLADAINGWVDGLWDIVTSFFGNLDYKSIFNGLKDFITNLDSKTIATFIGIAAIKKFGRNIATAIKENTVVKATLDEVGITIAGVAFAWAAGVEIGKLIDDWIADEIRKSGGDSELSDLYENFHWTGEGGFFDQLFGNGESVVDVIYDIGTAMQLMVADIVSAQANFFGLKIKAEDVLKVVREFPIKTIKIAVKISTKAKDLWEEFKKGWENVKDKVVDFKTRVKSKASDLWNDFKKNWGESRTAHFLLSIKSKISELWGNFKKSWGELKTANFKLKISSKISELWNGFKRSWGDSKKVSIGIEFVRGALNGLWTSVKNFFGGKSISVGASATKKADGGVFSGGSWKPIKKYAVGGLPNMGQMFVAREAGPELVGTLGGHTAVMNNDQIVSSVSVGVAQAVKEVIQPLLKASVGNNRPIQISLDGKVIFDSTRQSAQEYFNRTGMSPFPV